MDKMKYKKAKAHLNSAYGYMVTGKKINPIKRFFMHLYLRFLFKTNKIIYTSAKMVYTDTDSVR